MYISVNGLLIEDYKGCISPMSEAYSFGYGVFETIKVIDRKLLFFEEHMNRMAYACKLLNLKENIEINHLKKYCDELLFANLVESTVLKIFCGKDKENTDTIITTRKNAYQEENYCNGFKLCFAETKRNPYSPLTYIKASSYLENIYEKQRGLSLGFDEVLFLNVHDRIAEGSISNVFYVKDSTLYTPDVDCGILPGILREKIVDIVQALGIPLKVGKFTKNEILKADEIFITNSVLEIMPVSQLEERRLILTKNSTTQLIMKAYHQYAKKRYEL